MDALAEVAEGSTAYLTVQLLDKAGAAAVPSTLRYRIDCGTTGEQVRDWTTLTPSAEPEIRLTLNDNGLRSQDNAAEERVVTVEAGYGLDDLLRAQAAYTVRNLRFVT